MTVIETPCFRGVSVCLPGTALPIWFVHLEQEMGCAGAVRTQGVQGVHAQLTLKIMIIYSACSVLG